MSGGRSVLLVLGTAAGGVGVHVLSLARWLATDGWRVSVGAPAATLATFDFAAAGAEAFEVPIRGAGRELLAVPALRRVGQADVVHAHGLRAGVACALAGRRPLVVSWHNAVLTTGPAARLGAVAESLVARRAAITLAASADLAATARARGARDVRVLPVAPPPAPVRAGRAATRAALGVAADELLVLSIGRLHPQKDPAALVRAAVDWGRRPAVLLIAGDGPSRSGTQAAIQRTHAPVRLLGRRDDVGDLLAAADVFVLASRWDARPLVLQEAMRAGTPVIATAVGGVPDLVGDAARLVPPQDPVALSQALNALLDDPAARAALGRAGRERAADWPDETDTARAVGAVYREVLAR